MKDMKDIEVDLFYEHRNTLEKRLKMATTEDQACIVCGKAEIGYHGVYSIRYGEEKIETEIILCNDCGNIMVTKIIELSEGK